MGVIKLITCVFLISVQFHMAGFISNSASFSFIYIYIYIYIYYTHTHTKVGCLLHIIPIIKIWVV